MKTAVLFIAFLFTQIPVLNSHTLDDDNEKGIVFFEGSWQEALTLARQENKLIFLDAYASWCSPCKMMKWKVFSTKQAGDFFNVNFINVKMDMEKGEGLILSEKYKIEAYPTLLFSDHTGKIKKYSIGYLSVSELIDFAQQALK